MYIPKVNLVTDQKEIISFMQQFSFATLVTSEDNLPVATHLPLLVKIKDDKVLLVGHFAKANTQWQNIMANKVLVIFSEPHAYISPKNYDKELNVPTWNYISVHSYGWVKLITDKENVFEILAETIQNFEPEYKSKWDKFPEDYRLKMINGIVAFEIEISELQAKYKLSQNRTDKEKEKIINNLTKSKDTNEKLIADYMNKH